MQNGTVRWTAALTVALVLAPVTGSLVAGQERAGSGPPGVVDGTLASPSALLEAHTASLLAAGFSASGTANVTVVRRGVLVDVKRSVDRTVATDAAEYRQFRRSVARAAVASVTRNETFWGNDSVEVRRRVENGETTYSARRDRSNASLAATTVLAPFLRSADYAVTDAAAVGSDLTTAETVTEVTASERRYVLTANELANATRMRDGLPAGATDPRNLDATVVVDGEGRVREFDASVDYAIRGTNRTQTVSFDLRRLGVGDVSRPAWVDDALANATGA